MASNSLKKSSWNKKFLLLLVFFCGPFSLNLFSQINLPYPDSTGAWIIRGHHFDPPSTVTTWGFRYFVDGDTIVDSTQYQKVYYGSSYLTDTTSALLYGFQRIDSGKVYYKEANANYTSAYFNDTEEILLYDFNLGVGDSMLIANDYMGLDCYVHVDSINNIVVGSQTLTRWYMTWDHPMAYMPVGYTWIEGIGSSIGYFPFEFQFEGGSELACFHENSQTYIQNLFGGSSCETVGLNEALEELGYTIYPNPSTGLFTLKTDGMKGKLSVYNDMGKVILAKEVTGNSVLVDLANEANGIYYLSLQTDKGIYSVKMVKE